ncbi:hypothetical protein J6590_013034 [Homalodisca vitripennis]|nr:hypothetical protein J6590_013034 [Homalodisca vitripennis]
MEYSSATEPTKRSTANLMLHDQQWLAKSDVPSLTNTTAFLLIHVPTHSWSIVQQQNQQNSQPPIYCYMISSATEPTKRSTANLMLHDQQWLAQSDVPSLTNTTAFLLIHVPIDTLMEYSSATEPTKRSTANLLLHDQQWLAQSDYSSATESTTRSTANLLLHDQQWLAQSDVPSLTNTTAFLLIHVPIDTLMEYSSATEPTKRSTANLLLHDQQWLGQSDVPSLTNTTAFLLIHVPIDTLMEYISAMEPRKRITTNLLLHDQQWLGQSDVPSLTNTTAFLLITSTYRHTHGLLTEISIPAPLSSVHRRAAYTEYFTPSSETYR